MKRALRISSLGRRVASVLSVGWIALACSLVVGPSSWADGKEEPPRLMSRPCVEPQACADGSGPQTCREWCLITADGRDIPLGQTCCPLGAADSALGFASCSPLRAWGDLGEDAGGEPEPSN